jgi:Tol biopolymer transport system component
MASLEAQPILGTEGGSFPFWSPDGRFVAFFVGGKLKKVHVTGGPPVVVCDAPSGRGGTWNRDNIIVFNASSAGGGLMRVSSAGGTPAPVTMLDPSTGETNHRWPHFLPDGRHFLYTAVVGTCCPAMKPAQIRIGSLDANDADITLLQAESAAIYSSGHLLFNRDDTLMAQRFAPETRQIEGDPFPVVESVSNEGSRYVGASVSETETLVYGHGGSPAALQLTWVDRTGRVLGTFGEAQRFISRVNLALSPDERRVAVALGSSPEGDAGVWTVDIARGVRSRQTADVGVTAAPVFSPDGSRIAFEAARSGIISLRQKLVDSTAADEALLEGSTSGGDVTQNMTPTDWSRDGRFIAYTRRASSGSSDVWVLPLFGDRRPFPIVQTPSADTAGMFSPDGRWIAYMTAEGGQSNVFVQPFPRGGERHQVSRDGGSHPVWRADGRELFYLASDGTMMAVPIQATDRFSAGVPQALFQTTTGTPRFNTSNVYAATKDAKRFVMISRPQRASAADLTVVVNWPAAIPK